MGGDHLRHHKNILKRLLIHAGAFNLSLILWQTTGVGTPREFNELPKGLSGRLFAFAQAICTQYAPILHPSHISRIKIRTANPMARLRAA